MAHLAPVSDSLPLSESFIRHCTDELSRQGYTGVVTSALAPLEQEAFIHAGFGVEQRLHLLSHDLSGLDRSPPPEGIRLRRGRGSDLPAVVAVDRLAFDSFWTMDEYGLRDAMTATPRARFRVAVGRPATGRATVVGYAITGRAGRRGYLQRLAVAADERGRGIGTALVTDGLSWLSRRGVDRCLVNTQLDNQGALALYRHLGFRPEPAGLAVLALRLTP